MVYNLGISKIHHREAKANEIALGLDLKGGMSVTMEISLDELIANLADTPDDANFNQALETAVAKSRTSNTSLIDLFLSEYEATGAGTPIANFFATTDNARQISGNSCNLEVRSFLNREADNAIQNSFKVLRTRIDKFGVSSPNIQIQQGTNRILVELPGVTDEERVRKLLQGSANLEFYQTYNNVEIYALLEKISITP